MERDPIWKSMYARRIPATEPMDETETKLAKAFRTNHYIFGPELSPEMDLIQSKVFCKKCLLFTNLCQTVGNHVKEVEEEILRAKYQAENAPAETYLN